jgi:hypothetical protein
MSANSVFSRTVYVSLGLAAAALSSTVFRSELIPVQLNWLGSAGTLVAATLLVVAANYSTFLSKRRGLFTVVVICALLFVISIRASAIRSIYIRGSQQLVILGWSPNDSASVLKDCPGSTAIERLDCAGQEAIPSVYNTYYWAYWLFLVSYLALFAGFVLLLSITDFGPSVPSTLSQATKD